MYFLKLYFYIKEFTELTFHMAIYKHNAGT